ADLVVQCRVHRRARGPVDELDQTANPPPHVLDHRQGDVLPEALRLQLLDQGKLCLHRGYRVLALKVAGDLDDPVVSPNEVGRGVDQGDLQVDAGEVEQAGGDVPVVQLAWQAGDVFAQLGQVRVGQPLPTLPRDIAVHVLQLRAHDEVVPVHRRHFAVENLDQVVPELGDPVVRRGLIRSLGTVGIGGHREGRKQLQALLEQTLAQRFGQRGCGAGRVLVEVLEVLAEVEDQELGLVQAGPEQVGAQAGAAADHLQELDLRAYCLEEDQVDHFRHVDAGV